ncbi:MAG TPA: EthD family reductase [Acetobacteraceae bacterium]|nr:EthD family reductase [Acetobacteraceae bacterium]
MIAAISLMRQRDDVTLAAFRRHWLDVHGPLVCAFPALRCYVQHHVVASPAMNAQARDMRIDGFPILWFDNDADRLRAHHSPEMAACNVDSRQFIGAVSRVICEPQVVQRADDAARMRLMLLLPGETADDGALQRLGERARALPRLAGLVLYRVLEQGRAPNSTIPHLPVSVAGIAELAFPSQVDLECAMAGVELGAAQFVVEEHRLV